MLPTRFGGISEEFLNSWSESGDRLLRVEIELSAAVGLEGHDKRPLSGHRGVRIELVAAGSGLPRRRQIAEHGSHSRHAHARLNLHIVDVGGLVRGGVANLDCELIGVLFHGAGVAEQYNNEIA